MASGSVFSKTLQTITTTKLEELSKRYATFSERYNALLADVQLEKDPLERLQKLANGTKLCLGVKTSAQKDGSLGKVIAGASGNHRLERDLENLQRFTEQARFDPSVSIESLKSWEDKLLQYLSVQATKFQYADLYGKLVTEWLSCEKDDQSGDSDVKMDNSFEEVPGRKRVEAQAEWENTVFEPANVNIAALQAYLDELFNADNKHVASAVNELRESVQKLENNLASPCQFNNTSLRWSIEGLMNSDLLSNEKREVIGDFLTNDVILSEISDVLNMRIEALDSWTWGDHVVVEQRRNINGRFSIHLHEDLLQAIFLYYIGSRWSVFFKKAFKSISTNSNVWKSGRPEISKLESTRRGYYLGNKHLRPNGSFRSKRTRIHQNKYFAYRLLDDEQQQIEVADGEDEAEVDDQLGSNNPFHRRKRQATSDGIARRVSCKAPRMQPMATGYVGPEEKDEEKEESCDESDDDYQTSKKPMDAKQNLLHLLSTEILINKGLYGELTCFRTVFDSWNSLLPHETVLTILEAFGVSDRWRAFFRTYLQTPLKLENDRFSMPRPRLRGIPDSHILSDVLGEVVFFCLDFSVNQSTDGQFIHRVYDDVWFWHKDYHICAEAWRSVLEFTDIMGVKVDKAKTGSIRIGRDEELVMDDSLPEGDIQWGFLHMDPSSGQFKINQKMVESHAQELRHQLESKSNSVFNWIQGWNSYADTFFSSNFGKAANCFGREHVDNMLTTHRRIQEIVFDGGNVTQHLRKTIEDRFGVSNIPDGFFFWPLSLGGLGLSSPFVNLLQIRGSVTKHPYHEVQLFLDWERDDYAEAQAAFDKPHTRQRQNSEYPNFVPEEGPDEFFTFEEYVRYREEFRKPARSDLCALHDTLMRPPGQEQIGKSEELNLALSRMSTQNSSPMSPYWHNMSAYWKYVASTYGPEMVAKFGGLNIVEPGWLPIGMVSQFSQRRTKWQG